MRIAPVALLGLLVPAACAPTGDVVVGEDFRRVHDPLQLATKKLDVLFVVDASGSMMPEQAALIASAGEQLFGQLATDLGGPADLHLAIISPDVGTGIPSVPGCPATNYDGRFRIGTEGAVCPIDGTFIIDEDDGQGGRTVNYTGTLADAFGCAASLGFAGCGFEQPLEATRLALDGTHPENAGFLREDALLLVVFVTDEDDCSVYNPEMFGEPQADLTSALGPRNSFRCFEFGVVCDPDVPRAYGQKTGCVAREDSAYIHPVGRYIDFFRGLKADPATVLIAGIYGPVGPVVVGDSPDIPPNSGYLGLQYTCSAPETNVAASPPIRLVQVADQFPSRFVFESLCDSAMSQRLYRVTRSATGVMQQRPCLIGDLSPQLTAERCRAFDVAGTTQTPIDRCGGGTTSNCFELAPSPQCDYTPSGLAASYRGSLAAGHRMVVECLSKIE